LPRILALALAATFLAHPVRAQDSDTDTLQGLQTPHLCILPEEPLIDESALEQIGITLADEFSNYFDAITAYIMCLDRSREDAIRKSTDFLRIYESLQTR
jgi:hypothetical protein